MQNVQDRRAALARKIPLTPEIIFSNNVSATLPARPMDATPLIQCECKIQRGRIVFCRLHVNAEYLVAVCRHLRKFLAALKIAEEKDEIMIREVILPYVDKVLARVEKKGS